MSSEINVKSEFRLVFYSIENVKKPVKFKWMVHNKSVVTKKDHSHSDPLQGFRVFVLIEAKSWIKLRLLQIVRFAYTPVSNRNGGFCATYLFHSPFVTIHPFIRFTLIKDDANVICTGQKHSVSVEKVSKRFSYEYGGYEYGGYQGF